MTAILRVSRPAVLFLVLSTTLFFTMPRLCRAENISFPAGSAIINITNAPYNARGDGVTDCTAAIQQAMNDWVGHNAILYFPNGTYLVSDQLTWYNQDSYGQTAWGDTFIQGQSRNGTIIKLKNSTFTNPGSPKAMMSCVGFGSADWFNNYVQNVTFHTGTGNPGAIGLRFYSNNTGAVRDVSIISGDGQGVTGLDLNANMNGPLLVRNLLVQGFATGIRCGNSVNSQTFEHITLLGQTSYGFYNSGQTVGVRDLVFSGAALAVRSTAGLLSLLDANLMRTSGSGAAVSCTGGYLHVRNLMTAGCSPAISCFSGNQTGPNVTEYFSHTPTSPFPSSSESINLPIQEPPEVPWDDPATWANVNDFGADPSGSANSRAAIQAAIDSGATTIWFPGSYRCDSAVTVRNNARRLIGAGNYVDYNGDTGLDFIVANGTSPTVIFEHIGLMSGGMRIDTTRDVVIRSCGVDHIIQTDAAGRLFIEDMAMGWIPPNLSIKGSVWARQLNPEVEGEKVLNDGGNLWVLGLKTERSGTLVETRNGGKSEIFGNFSYTTTHSTAGAMFVNNNSSMFTEITEVCYTGQPFDNVIQETRGGTTITVSRNSGWIAPYIGHTNASGGLAPAVDFSCTAVAGMAPLTIRFTDNSTNNSISWSWSFGDGATSTTRHPTHLYAFPGDYVVVLTAANAYGTNTTTNYISVTSPLLKVASTATNTAVVSWPFPCADWQLQQNDDVGSTNWAPSPGPIQNDGSNNFVVVNAPSSALFYRLTLPAPVAEFTGTPTSGTSPLTVDFSDASLRKPASWAWTFGDGGTSAEQNPSHQYVTDGTYTVSLTVSNAYGSGVQTKTNYITVNAPTSPVADFVATPASGIRPLTVNFTDTSINSPTAWHWTFGDGGSSNDQNPSHQYTAIGNFTVALSVQNGAGSDSETKVNYITVTNSLPSPWLDQDIPSAASGSATYNAGIFTVRGAGVDMYGIVDSFHFVYQVLATNRCTIVARVTSQQNTASYAKAGAVIRESLAGGARGGYMVLTPSDQSAFGWRSSLNGSTSDANGGYHSPPYWVKMVRNGNSFSAYQSSNGSTWTQVGSTQTIVFGSTSYVGLCVCSAANPTLATDTFDNVSVTVP